MGGEGSACLALGGLDSTCLPAKNSRRNRSGQNHGGQVGRQHVRPGERSALQSSSTRWRCMHATGSLASPMPMSHNVETLMGPSLARWKPVAAIAVLLGLAFPASASASVRAFHSPTGNVTCEASVDGTSGTWVRCQSFRGPKSVRLSGEGEVGICHGRDCLRPRPLNSMRLKYGASVRVGPFRCLSRRYTMSCVVISNGRRHGFGINLHAINYF
jgi:hypothetical protein